MVQKNEFSHSSISRISIAKTEKRKISLEQIIFGVIALALVGVYYCNHVKQENAKNFVDYSFKVSTSAINSSYSGEYKK